MREGVHVTINILPPFMAQQFYDPALFRLMLASEHFNPIYGTYDALKNIKGGPFEMDIFLRATREGLLSLEFQGKIFSLFQEQLQRASAHLFHSEIRTKPFHIDFRKLE
jgi:hypothetical protein